jgi:hypothetical protein
VAVPEEAENKVFAQLSILLIFFRRPCQLGIELVAGMAQGGS